MRAAIRALQYLPGVGTGDLAGALREARTTQFTVSNGARLGVPNVAVILTAARTYPSAQVRCRLRYG